MANDDLQIAAWSSTGAAVRRAEASIPASISRSAAYWRARNSSFRVERDPASAAAGAAYRLSDLEIASRLSFFLWSSIPDDTLLDVASQGTLKTPAVLEQQVRRMLADPRSQALVENFVGQWLHLRNLEDKQPNSHEFPDFDDNLRQAMQTEVELFVARSFARTATSSIS